MGDQGGPTGSSSNVRGAEGSVGPMGGDAGGTLELEAGLNTALVKQGAGAVTTLEGREAPGAREPRKLLKLKAPTPMQWGRHVH